METIWIDLDKNYKSNTGSNYASQSYHNDLYGPEVAFRNIIMCSWIGD